jgi:hypothetical protein
LRFVKGTALYTTTFTPSTTPLTTTSQGATATEVELLTCQSNRFLDNSSNAFSITVTGTPSVQAFSPFAPTAAYDSAVVGGSGYFDGSGDYLDVGSNANLTIGTSDFSISFWLYLNSLSATAILFDGRSSAVTDSVTPLLNATSSTASLTYRVNGTVRIDGAASSITTGQWYYVVLSRLSGTTRIFANGVQQGSDYTDGNNYIAFASDRPRIGDRGNSSGAGFPLNGYMSGLQMLIGTGTSSPTTPTAPPTNVANTQLLLNYTNAGIYDAAAKNDLETVGNASVSTTQAKFGTTSIFFDGNGDYLSSAPVTVFNPINNGNCTVEMWVYSSNSSTTLKCLFDNRSATGTNTGYGIFQTGTTISIYGQGVKGNAVSTFTGNTWTHLAVTRANVTNYVFIGGTLVNTFTYGNTFTSGNVTVGADVSGGSFFTGYIDEVRITNGVARYTNNFSVPTTVFPTQ